MFMLKYSYYPKLFAALLVQEGEEVGERRSRKAKGPLLHQTAPAPPVLAVSSFVEGHWPPKNYATKQKNFYASSKSK